MKLVFVIPSREFLGSAGARIRYLRMIPLLQQAGHSLELVPIGDFVLDQQDADVVVFSKCFDARAIVLAARLRRHGCLVGVDLFDDYFSQDANSALTLYRTWLSQMCGQVQFVLCSTRRMAQLTEKFAPHLPTHVFNDPALDLRSDTVGAILDAKLKRMRETKSIRLCWFGIGDNPFFEIGLDDLTAFGSRLAILADRGWQAELTVSTNLRALTAERLARIGRLPLPTRVELWTEEGETARLLDSDCCFLPVNAQPFSIAKSLNRAVSALTAGCQVIWAGYPLYAAFDPIIYADAGSLLDDLENGAPRLSSARIDHYAGLMRDHATLHTEVARVIEFLGSLDHRSAKGEPSGLAALVHGKATNGNAHKLARQGSGVLSVGTPFSPPSLVYDVIFTGQVAGGDLRMLVAETAVDRLRMNSRERLVAIGRINKTNYFALSDEGPPTTVRFDWSSLPVPCQLAAYHGIFDKIRQRLCEAFGEVEILISESEKLPFDPAARLFDAGRARMSEAGIA